MEKCPHCQFLVRDGSRVCGVCHKPIVAGEGGMPSFLSGERSHGQTLAAHVGPGEAGVPLSLIVLFSMAIVLAVVLVVGSQIWL